MIAFNAVSFGWKKKLFDHAEFCLPDTGCFALMGKSGSGKTTLLRLLAGLLRPDEGTVTGTEGKKIAMLFQEDRLLPWRTALRNAAEGSDEIRARQWLDRLEIRETDAYPDMLSGGMQRRVSLARALAFGGDILLMDEPFKGLDEELRERTAERIKEAGFPLILFSTHDPEEARLMDAQILNIESLKRGKDCALP